MEELLARYGPVAAFVLATVESDGVLLITGVLAHLNLMHPATAVLAGALGAFAGDCILFATGRGAAERVRASAVYRRVGPTVERLANRFGAREIFLCRLVYGTRMASMLFWGTQGLSWGRFVLLDLPACLVWGVALVTIAYFSSDGIEALMGSIRRVELWLLGAVVIVVLVELARRYLAPRLWRRP